jgi:MATE family multidrug resistance protein
LASGYTLLFCGVYLFLPDLILKPYGLAERPELRALVVSLLRFVAFYSFFDSMLVVFNAAIRGAGDTRFAMTFSFSMGLLLLVLPTYVAATVFGTDGFSAAWYAVTVYITVLGLGFMARFQQGRWKSMKVIEHTAADVGNLPVDDAPGAAVSAAVS